VYVVKARVADFIQTDLRGALARHYRKYAIIEEGMEVRQGDDAGFIKFGSSRYLFPLGTTKVEVKLQQKKCCWKQTVLH
jgi:phosphatidylserine decarboxylase